MPLLFAVLDLASHGLEPHFQPTIRVTFLLHHLPRVECKARTLLQEPIPTEGCPRLNGYFNPEDPALCDEYTTCVDGNPTPGKCSTGVVWSPSILACTRPDQAKRPECVAAVIREFDCPKTRKLRWDQFYPSD